MIEAEIEEFTRGLEKEDQVEGKPKNINNTTQIKEKPKEK